MNIDEPRPQTIDEMQTSLDRAAADVAAGRVVPAHEVHARLRRAVIAATPEHHGTHSGH